MSLGLQIGIYVISKFWILLSSSWDPISAVSDDIILPNSGISITCGLNVTHFWVAPKSIQYAFPQPFYFWDQGQTCIGPCEVSDLPSFWGWQVLRVQSQDPLLLLLSLFFLLSSCVLGSSTSFLPHPSPTSISLWSLRFIWIPLGHMEKFCLLYSTTLWPWRNVKLPQALLQWGVSGHLSSLLQKTLTFLKMAWLFQESFFCPG